MPDDNAPKKQHTIETERGTALFAGLLLVFILIFLVIIIGGVIMLATGP